MTLNKLFAVITCGCGLVLGCPCESAHAASSKDGTGHISCHATFNFQFDQIVESSDVNYEFDIVEAGEGDGFVLTGVVHDLDENEAMNLGPDPVKIRKKGSKFTARSSSLMEVDECDEDELDAEGNCESYEISTRFRYRKNGGHADFRIRSDNGGWVDVLNFQEKFDGGFASGKGECTFIPTKDWEEDTA